MTTAAINLTPGNVVTAPGTDADGLDLTQSRTVQSVRPFVFSDVIITFTCGTTARVGRDRKFQVAGAAVPADPEIQRIVHHLRTSPFGSTAEHVLNTKKIVVDDAIHLGLIKVHSVRKTTYSRRPVRFLAAA